MKNHRIAEPDYSFEMETITEKEVNFGQVFTSKVSIIKCTQGHAVISVNSKTHELKAGANFILIESMLFRVVECSRDFSMTVCCFSMRFFNEIYSALDVKVINMLLYNAPDLCGMDEMGPTDMLFRQLCALYENKEHSYRDKLVVNLVINYALEIYERTYRYAEESAPSPSYWKAHIADSFWYMCTNEHMRHRNLDYYAGKLNISGRYLHSIIKASFQLTPKQVIDYIASGTAKKLLLTTTLNNQQIADKMNFPDQATFGQFFKRNVGMSPSEFRNRYK